MFRQFLKSRHGNFGIITALLATPLCGVVGLAIDFSVALQERENLLNAADAAAVGAISEKSKGVAKARTMGGNGSVQEAIDEARDLFLAQTGSRGTTDQVDPNSTITPLRLDIDVRRSGQNLDSDIRFEKGIPTTFLQLFGKKEVVISGKAKATYQLGAHIDFYVLLDNTPSMGVGATAADIALMEKNTKDTCAFACHEVQNTNNYYNLAKSLGVSMRIDIVRKATQELTKTAKATMLFANQYRMGVYTFGVKAEDVKLTPVAALSGDMDTVRTYAEAVDLMTIPKQGYNNDQQTSFDSALTDINKLIDAPGSGNTTNDRQKILFFVSDGVGDSYKPSKCTKKTTSGRCQEPIDTSYCKLVKDRHIKIAVLYTTYLPLPKNSWYNSWIKPFQSEISTKMQECASPGLFFEVSPTEGITEAMQALFMKVINQPRLTQ